MLNTNIKTEIIRVIKIQINTLKTGIIFFNISKKSQKTTNGKLNTFFRVDFFTFFLPFHQKSQLYFLN